MTTRIRGRGFVAVFLLTLICHSAFATTIVVDPAAFSAGTDVSNLYSGVTLSTAQGSMVIFGTDVVEPLTLISDQSGPVYSTGSYFSPAADDSLWSAGQCCGADDVFRADFQNFATFVAMEFIPDDEDTGILQIYDAQDILLDEILFRSADAFTLELLSDVPIAYMLATGGDPLWLGALAFTEFTIPEPAGLGLFVVGIVAMGLARRMNRFRKKTVGLHF